MLIRAGRVFTGERIFEPGLLAVEGDRVVAVGGLDKLDRHGGLDRREGLDRQGELDLGAATVVPGFVDVHAHGGGGASFGDDPDTVLALHRAHGTTTMVASLVTQALDVLERQVLSLAARVEAGALAGVHLEGPWLAPRYTGAHPVARLRDPEPGEVRRLLDAGRGTVRMVTLAVERPGATESIRLLAGRGVVAALGHSDCDLATARAAIQAGVRGATHLFNAMPPLTHRAPGPVLALLEDERVWLEVVLDGVHVEASLVAFLVRQFPDRVVFVTDAMAAAGSGDGDYVLGDLPVEVRGGVARVAGTTTIAGSTLTLDAAVRNAVAAGVPWQDAVRAATVLPARYLGLDGVGVLAAGAWADAVVLDEGLAVRRVLHRGRWVG